MPVIPELFSIFRTYHQNFSISFVKFLKILTQLRQMPPAEGSGKPAIENQQHVFLHPVMREADFITI